MRKLILRSRMFKTTAVERRRVRPIDIAPLVDVIFLLLIFFMLTSSFVVQSGIRVNIPKASTSELISKKEHEITINSEDIVFLDNTMTTIEDLRLALKKIVLKEKNPSLFLKADRLTSVGKVVEIWDLCREVGIENINIAASQSKQKKR